MAIGAQTPLDGAMTAEFVKAHPLLLLTVGELEEQKWDLGSRHGRLSPLGSSRKSRAPVILRGYSARSAKTKRALGDHTKISSFTSTLVLSFHGRLWPQHNYAGESLHLLVSLRTSLFDDESKINEQSNSYITMGISII